MYVKSKCTNENVSLWTGPISSTQILATGETSLEKVAVYPNPAKDFININTNSKVSKTSVYSTDGKQLLEDSSSKINVSKLPAGVYLLKIDFADGKTSTQKIVKQ